MVFTIGELCFIRSEDDFKRKLEWSIYFTKHKHPSCQERSYHIHHINSKQEHLEVKHRDRLEQIISVILR